MNEWFVNIKVDREERPDSTQIYMLAPQILTGPGGWPNNVFLTPDLKPFFAGSYFPPEDEDGTPGLPDHPQADPRGLGKEPRQDQGDRRSGASRASRGCGTARQARKRPEDRARRNWLAEARDQILAQRDKDMAASTAAAAPSFRKRPSSNCC